MSLRLCPLGSDGVALLVELARADRWDDAALSAILGSHGLDLRDARAELPGGHTVVLDESGGPEPTGAHLASAVFYQPDEDDEPDDDELRHDWATPGWDLHPVGDADAFLAAWRTDRDTVSAALNAAPAVELVEEDEDRWHTALWPVGRHALALSQTEHFDSYSLFDMTALWVCRRADPGPPVADQAYAWMTEFPTLLGN